MDEAQHFIDCFITTDYPSKSAPPGLRISKQNNNILHGKFSILRLQHHGQYSGNYGLNNPGFEPGRVRSFLFYACFGIRLACQPLSADVKRQGRGNANLRPSRTEIENEWNRTSTLPIRLHVVYRNIFTFDIVLVRLSIAHLIMPSVRLLQDSSCVTRFLVPGVSNRNGRP